MEKIILNNGWSIRKCGDKEYMSAQVPGSQFTDMLANGKINDPFVGENEQAAAQAALGDWEYMRTLQLPEQIRNKEHVILRFECLDTIARVYLNGNEIGRSCNYFIPLEIDLSGKLGSNDELKVLFSCPVQYVNERQEKDKMPYNSNGLNGIPHIRKPGCHFGWDWGPALPTVGIAGDVQVIAYDGTRITDTAIVQRHTDGKVTLNIECCIEGEPSKDALIEISVTAPDGSICGSEKIPAAKAQDTSIEITIDDPMLWWTADISGKSEQPLYTVNTKLIDASSSDSLTKKIGLRTIELDRTKDEYGSQFRFILNGKPMFIKGGNYIPPDALLTRADNNTFEYLLGAMVTANMNCVRVWGGGRYEKEEFYDICDRLGILVWQDFMFACQPYPFYDESLLDEIRKEVQYNVKRLRHRACLMLWCGNNEIEVMSPAWATYIKLREWTEKFFYHILPEELAKLDSVTPYIPGSPCGEGYLDKTASDNYGDTHLWSVWHGLQPLTYYRKRFSRFCSEFGLESIPDIETIEQFCPPEQMCLTSNIMQAHQKCLSGNDKIAYYISTRFPLPKKFDDLIYLSQITQSECIRDATEHWRRNRGRCNGSIYWQLNDCWPVMSWSSLDYYGRYKALQYAAKHFNAPLTVSVAEDKNGAYISVLNDTLKDFTGKVSCKLLTFDGKTIKESSYNVACGSCDTTKLEYINLARALKKVKRNCVLLTMLSDSNGDIVARKTSLFAPEKKLKLPSPNLQASVEVIGKKAYITITSDTYARYVKISAKGVATPFDDNYFDMIAGESKTVSIDLPKEMSAQEVKQIISLRTAANIKPKGSKLHDSLFRWKVRLKPINIANWIGYHFM